MLQRSSPSFGLLCFICTCVMQCASVFVESKRKLLVTRPVLWLKWWVRGTLGRGITSVFSFQSVTRNLKLGFAFYVYVLPSYMSSVLFFSKTFMLFGTLSWVRVCWKCWSLTFFTQSCSSLRKWEQDIRRIECYCCSVWKPKQRPAFSGTSWRIWIQSK